MHARSIILYGLTVVRTLVRSNIPTIEYQIIIVTAQFYPFTFKRYMAPTITTRTHDFQQCLPPTPTSFRPSGVTRPPLLPPSLTMICLRQRLFILGKTDIQLLLW